MPTGLHEFFNVGTGKGSSVLEVVNSFKAATGVDVPYQIGSRREGDITEIYADTSVAEKQLNWKSELSLEDALKLFLELGKELSKNRGMKTIIITGGAGFIGSHVVRRFVNNYPEYKIVNLDALTYAGNLENLKDVENATNYVFEHADITDAAKMKEVFAKYNPVGVVHLAAESHVDRSISGPMAFVETNIIGTVNLLNAARETWNGEWEGKRFYHVSTDEVYGSLGDTGFFYETTAYDPRSPYSASKASSDHLVRAYFHTYGRPL